MPPARWDKSRPDLFGCGAGQATSAAITCEFCGTHHEAIADYDSVPFTHFAGKCVAYCCFEDIETAVWDRIGDILPWVYRALVQNREEIGEQLRAIDQ